LFCVSDCDRTDPAKLLAIVEQVGCPYIFDANFAICGLFLLFLAFSLQDNYFYEQMSILTFVVKFITKTFSLWSSKATLAYKYN
jgi:hypothetical protein